MIAAAVLGGIWFFLAPVGLGGATTYVITHGISMEPRFHTGDLALVRSADDYRVGDVVAYQSSTLHTIVLHRIIARDGDRYVFKGDNNDFLDPEHPSRGQLLGKLWMHLPGVGGKLGWIHKPATIGLLAGLGSLLLIATPAADSRRRRRRRRDGAGRAMSDRQARAATTGVEMSLILSAAAGVVCIGLAAVAFTLPTAGSVTSPVPYTQNGTLSYTATAAASVLYPSGHATTGDPLFLGSVQRATIQFRYQVSTGVQHAVSGTASLAAEVASPTGWKRTLQLQPPTPFTGDGVFVTAPLPLARIEVLVRQVEAMIGGGSFTVTFIPHVSVHGTIAGAALNDRFAPHFAFSLDPNQLAPPTATAAPVQAGPAAPAATNPFVTSTTGSAMVTHSAARDVSLRIVRIKVADARWIAMAGAGIALCALLASLMVIARGRRSDEAARIESRYGDRLITVTRSDRRSYDEVVELASITALALVADRYDRMILHEQSDHGHSYRVADEGVLYVYLVGHDRSLLPTLPEPPRTPPPPPVAPVAPPPLVAPPAPVTTATPAPVTAAVPAPVTAATSALEPSRQSLSDRLRQLAREFNSS